MKVRTKTQQKNKRRAINQLENKILVSESCEITAKEYSTTATRNNLSLNQLKKAHMNLLRNGCLDRRIKTGKSTMSQKQIIQPQYFTDRKLTPKQAAKIVLAWIDSTDKSRVFCNKHKIPVTQLYDMLREIEITGKLKGKQVLDPTNFSKPIVCDVIWYYKHPNTNAKRITKLSANEKIVYKRVAIVLKEYLNKIINSKKK